MTPLRHIAVYVEEPKAGEFRWVLIERSGNSWRLIKTSDSPLRTYQKAMAEGLISLQGMTVDLDVGPRAGQDDTRPAANEQRPRRREEADAQEPMPGDSFFGFGPAR